MYNNYRRDEEHENKKRDVACSTSFNSKKGYSTAVSIDSKRWQNQASAIIPRPWKLVLIKQMRPPIILSKQNPRIKFFPMYLWQDPEPEIWKMLLKSIWVLGAEAASRRKTHKETQWPNEEVDLEAGQVEEKLEEKIEVEMGNNEETKLETNIVEEDNENKESEAVESPIDEENNFDNDNTIVESEDLEESSPEKPTEEDLTENTLKENSEENNEDLTENIPQDNSENNNENVIDDETSAGKIEQSYSETIPEITIEESDEVIVEDAKDDEDKEDKNIPNNDEQAKDEKSETAIEGKEAESETVEEKQVESEVVVEDKEAKPEAIVEDKKVEAGVVEDKQFDSKAIQTNFEEPMSFYVRRVSISSRSGENSPKPVVSPPPPPTVMGNQKSLKTKDPPESPVKGGVSVFVPGLMDAAKESVQRRLRLQSNSPDVKRRTASETRPASIFNATKTQTIVTPVSSYRTWRSDQVVRKVNTQQVDSPNQTQYFVFEPQRQPITKTETIQNVSPPWNAYQQQRIYQESPITTGSFLLGQSVFRPVSEVERIRDNFNRRSESRAQSYSRSPSVMSQSYHETRDQDNFSIPDYNEPVNVRRYYYPQRTDFDSRTWSQNPWTLKEDRFPEPTFQGPSIGTTTRVLERKVTEKHIEKDEEDRILNGWQQQDWKGTHEQFFDPDCTPLL
ncbi:hypothetical protein FO519_003279 [Halicephalobus sp. NKZ332]|nr:hypothetical protein FO519_003279 [Halicephalobus sp. NKZ332]